MQRLNQHAVADGNILAFRNDRAVDGESLTDLARANLALKALLDEKTELLRKAEETLTEKYGMLAIGELAAMIVHEIRTPLSTIDMAFDYLKQIGQPEKAEKRIRLAAKENRRLMTLLSDVLTFASPKNIEFARVNLSETILEVVAGLCDENGQQHKIDYSLPTPDIYVTGDCYKLKQLFINLLMNACQATTGDRVEISIYPANSAGLVQVEIRNPGTIPENVLSRITEPFVTTRPAGTGLGLAIVKRIVDAHNGQLEFDLSAPGEVCVRVSLSLSELEDNCVSGDS